MNLKKINETKEETELVSLLEYLSVVIANCRDRLDGSRELVENEFITDEFFERIIEGEKMSFLKEIQNYIDLYKGLN